MRSDGPSERNECNSLIFLSSGSSSDIELSGEGCDNLLELSGLSISIFYAAAWKRDFIDYTELASKRRVEKLSMDRIATEMGWGRTAVIRYLARIRANHELVADGQVRLRIYRRKYKFMGKAE